MTLAEGAVVLMTLTAYGASPACGMGTDGRGITKAGTTVQEGWTVACDPDVLPLGSMVRIEGVEGLGPEGELMCVDVGGLVKGRHIDVYLDDRDGCGRHRQFGRRRALVEVVHIPGENE